MSCWEKRGRTGQQSCGDFSPREVDIKRERWYLICLGRWHRLQKLLQVAAKAGQHDAQPLSV